MAANIKVAVRVRPFTDSELQSNYVNTHIKVDKRRRQVRVEPVQDQQVPLPDRTYSFDCVLSEKSTQEEVYKGCGIDYLLAKVLEGYHSTILVYGQTGSGKTFTMQGGNASEIGDGIVPRVVDSLFERIRNTPQKVVSVSVSYLQIYSEKIYDLLNPGSFNPKLANGGNCLRLRWNKDEQFTVENLFVCECQDKQELLQHVKRGLANRVNGTHKLNISSSRSHTILTLRVKCFDKEDPGLVFNSRIELVDLAGSERTAFTGSQGRLAKESIDINKSLFALRQVINVLSEQQQTHIPYRESKLTSLLKQSIGGSSYCLMIACLSPNDLFLDENISTLTYATKASMIQNVPTPNKDPHKKQIDELKDKIKELNTELQKANRSNDIVKKVQKQKEDSEKVEPEPTANSTNKKLNFNSLMSKAAALLSKVEVNQNKGGQQTTKGESYWDMLLESVAMVRDLLKSNRDLREQIDTYRKLVQERDLQIHELYRQNEQLKSSSQDYQHYQTNKASFKKPSRVSSRIDRHKTEQSPDRHLYVPVITMLAKQRKAAVQLNTFSTEQLSSNELKSTTLLEARTPLNRKQAMENLNELARLDILANRTRTRSSNDKYLETPMKRTLLEPFQSYNKR